MPAPPASRVPRPVRLLPRLLVGGLLLSLASLLGACGGPWRDTYLQNGVGRLTQDEIREKFGSPHTAKTPALGGDSQWTYRFALSDQELTPWNLGFLAEASHSVGAVMGKAPDAPKPTLYCYRYRFTFTEDKVLKHWTRDECVPGTRNTLSTK